MSKWVCPESGDMYEKPGPCPDCGATLVPLEQELSEAEKIAYCKGWWDALETMRNRLSMPHSEDCYKWHHECAIAKIEREMK